jgi:beta-glucanase (GH16 family)
MKSIFLVSASCMISALPVFAQIPPAQAAAYKLVFSDDFSHFNLSPNGYGKHTWYPGIYYQGQAPVANTIIDIGSILDLKWERSSGEFNTSIENCSYNAKYCNTYRYGYFEARMKWDVTAGAWPAFWMVTKQGVLGMQHVGEIDIFEGQGNDPTHYYGTINEWNGPTDLVTTNSPLANRFQLAANNKYSEWHTYGLLWVPGRVTWYFDNVPVGTFRTAAIFDQQDFFIILGSQEGNNWKAGNLTGVTAQSINLDVDWVHVFQPASRHIDAATRQTPLASQVPEIVTDGLASLAGSLPDRQTLELTIDLGLRNEAQLDSILQRISDPRSSNYQQYLSDEEFTALFAPTQEEYDAVVNWAQSKGLTIRETTPNRRFVDVSASVGAIDQAFQITLNIYRIPGGGEMFFAPDREPTVDLPVQVLAITGLTNVSAPLPL